MSKKTILLSSVGGLILVLGMTFFFLRGGPSSITGPEDYVHFSDYFTMDESTANEMSMDGGTPSVAPGSEEALLVDAPAADNSPAVELQD